MSGLPLIERGLVRGGGRERRVNVQPTGAYVLMFLIVSHLEDDRRLTDGPRPNEAGVMGGRSAKLERKGSNRGSERASERARSGPKWASEVFQERRRARVRTRDWQRGWPFGRPLPQKSRTEYRIQESREVRPARMCASNQGGVCRHSAIEKF